MGLLKEAVNQTAYLKAGFMGFQGSGKTFTATRLAAGLAKLSSPKTPSVAFFDTETGSDFHIRYFKEHGVKLYQHKSRSFVEICRYIHECQAGEVDVLIIDSITHVWRELMTAYLKRKGRKFISLPDWGVLKNQWQELTDLYVNSSLHIIMCGRAGYEYETARNEDTGKQESYKSGVKMKVEGEMGYEPSLLIEMESIKADFDARKNQSKSRLTTHKAFVLKDRTDTLNGAVILNPKFDDFMPVIKFLNLGGKHFGVDTDSNSEDLFENPDRSYELRKRRQAIFIEELAEALVLGGLDGTSKEAKKGRTELLIKTFGTSSKTAIENKSLAELENGITDVRSFLKLPSPPRPVMETDVP